MRRPWPLVLLLFLVLGAAGAIHAQITNPIQAPVVKRGLSVEVRDLVRLPETRSLRPADQDGNLPDRPCGRIGHSRVFR